MAPNMMTSHVYPPMPRSREPYRRELERKFLAHTIAATQKQIPTAILIRIKKLFKRKPKYEFLNDEVRQQDDIDRRKAVCDLMELMIKAGFGELEDRAVAEIFRDMAGARGRAYKSQEDKHRGCIIAILALRVEKKVPEWQTAEYMRARKAGAKLLTDTLDLPNDGGISERSHKWLKKTFEKGKLLNTEAKREADEVARKCAVNYIAGCRREAGLQGELEQAATYNGYEFRDIDTSLTSEEVEAKDWSQAAIANDVRKVQVNDETLNDETLDDDDNEKRIERFDVPSNTGEDAMPPEPRLIRQGIVSENAETMPPEPRPMGGYRTK